MRADAAATPAVVLKAKAATVPFVLARARRWKSAGRGTPWVWSPAGWHAVCNSWALPRCFVASRSEFGTSAGQVPPEEAAEEAAEAAAEEEELLLGCMHLSRCSRLGTSL